MGKIKNAFTLGASGINYTTYEPFNFQTKAMEIYYGP
jgi:hypothetical protein